MLTINPPSEHSHKVYTPYGSLLHDLLFERFELSKTRPISLGVSNEWGRGRMSGVVWDLGVGWER